MGVTSVLGHIIIVSGSELVITQLQGRRKYQIGICCSTLDIYWKVNNGMHVHVPLRFHITFTFALVSFKRVTLHNYNCLEPPDWRFYGYNLADCGRFFLICQQTPCKDTYLDPI